MTDLRDAALRAGVFQVIEQRAKELKDQARQELQALEVGDTIAARWDGQVIAKATMNRGKTRLVVTDPQRLLEWVKANHPTEIVESVNPAYLKALEAKAKELGVGAVIDNQGEVIPGVEIAVGEPSVSVRKEPDGPFIVAQMLSAGRVQLDGIREIEA